MSKAKKTSKTNALRLLDSQKINYEIFEYSIEDGLIDGRSVCEKLSLSPHQMYKTLVTQCVNEKEYCVFVLPIDNELDLKKAAQITNSKKVELIPMNQMLEITGYMRGGCSPIGMKKRLSTYIEEEVVNFPFFYVSGGKKGLTIKIGVNDFLKVTEATVARICKK